MTTPLDAAPVARPAREVRRARLAVSAVFFVTGAGTANWAVRIPAMQERLGLDEGALGIALLGVSAGALLAMPLAGRLVARHGSRPVTWAAIVAFALALALPPQAAGLVGLVLALFTLGLANGLLDVSMNAHAATVGRRYAQPTMARIHAMYSLGGLAGAAVGGRVAAMGIDVASHLTVAAVVLAVIGCAVAPGLLPGAADRTPLADGPRERVRGSARALAPLGIVAFGVLFGEGAMHNWSAVYLRDVAGAGPGMAAAGFAAFSLAMAACRLMGDTLTTRLGPVRLARLGAALATLGITTALVVPHPLAIVAGFGAVGAGLSSIFPLALAAAARTPGIAPGAAIAVVSMSGYSGLLAGPPLIGAVSSWLTLRGGLVLVALSCAAVVLLARSMGRGEAHGREVHLGEARSPASSGTEGAVPDARAVTRPAVASAPAPPHAAT